MEHLDFSLSPVVLYALITGATLPLYLLGITRLSATAGHYALQFLASFLVVLVLWGGASFLWPGVDKLVLADILVALMFLGGAGLFYLEVWGLLSRGYTLALLVTLLKAGGSLTEDDLTRNYRGGEGLAWVMRHRLSGLIGVGLVKNKAGVIILTPFPGAPVAWLYKASIAVLGLRRTG